MRMRMKRRLMKYIKYITIKMGIYGLVLEMQEHIALILRLTK